MNVEEDARERAGGFAKRHGRRKQTRRMAPVVVPTLSNRTEALPPTTTAPSTSTPTTARTCAKPIPFGRAYGWRQRDWTMHDTPQQLNTAGDTGQRAVGVPKGLPWHSMSRAAEGRRLRSHRVLYCLLKIKLMTQTIPVQKSCCNYWYRIFHSWD